jgi:indole-3-pyruvate monooxygenase
MKTSVVVRYTARFLVVASGENSAENIPVIPGLRDFAGEAIHSSRFRSGAAYSGKNVLVVGCGNSGMEIAYDLASHGANTSIVVRSPVCVLFLFAFGSTNATRVELCDKVLNLS